MRETLTPGAGSGDFDRSDPVDPSVAELRTAEEAGCVLLNQAAAAGKAVSKTLEDCNVMQRARLTSPTRSSSRPLDAQVNLLTVAQILPLYFPYSLCLVRRSGNWSGKQKGRRAGRRQVWQAACRAVAGTNTQLVPAKLEREEERE